MGGADRLDQKTATYMIAHRSKKWWWPIFGFCLNLCANNRLQIFRHQKKEPRAKATWPPWITRSIVDTYYRR